MTELDPRIQALVEEFVRPPGDDALNWGDVRGRARRGRPRRLQVLLAATVLAIAAVAASPLRGAITDAFGSFSAWLQGEPGRPASSAEQRAFDQANVRSWASFPDGIKLRRLIETQVAGATYRLYGFRSGDSFCLKLVATIPGPDSALGCAPLSDLRTARAPAVVVTSDESFGVASEPPPPGGYTASRASATFGIVADGVRRIVLKTDDGAHEAVLGSNAFLFVADRPPVGFRVRAATAIGAGDQSAAVPLASAPFGLTDLPPAPTGEPTGPSTVDVQVHGGTIGWLARHEARGDDVPPKIMSAFGPRHLLVFARAIQPDPSFYARVIIGITREPGAEMCVELALRSGVGGGCSPGYSRLRESPFSVGQTNSGSSQYSIVAGAASDAVAAMKVFLVTGDVDDVPLKDNAYIVQVARTSYPIRLVAYDREGRVIGIQTWRDDGLSSAAPQAARPMRVALRVRGSHGATQVLRIGRRVNGDRCWRLDASSGASSGGCTPLRTGPVLALGTQRVGADVFLVGSVREDVASVEVRFADKETAVVRPVGGFYVLSALPAGDPRSGGELLKLIARGRSGNVIGRQGIRVAKR